MTSGASLDYRIKAATTSLYPGEVRRSNLHIFLWSFGSSARSVLSMFGAVEDSSTTCLTLEAKIQSKKGYLTHIVLGKAHVCFLLLPKEEDVEIFHEWYKKVGNILQHF